MKIGGYQKVSLIDYPGIIASVVFLRGCNFMCPYCHNPELISAEGGVVLESDFFTMLLENKKMIDGVCVSGGEPCLQTDLPEFLLKLKNMGFKVKLDTNGSKPEMVTAIINANLADYIAMDIKSSWENYHLIARPKDIVSKVKQSLAIIQQSNIDYEFRTTIFPGAHTMDDFIAIAGYLKKDNKYFIQDMKREKTLEKISGSQTFFAADIVAMLISHFPHLTIGYR